MVDAKTQATRYAEFQKEEKRRSVGQGSAKGGPRYDTSTGDVTASNYDGSAAQAWGVADGAVHKMVDRMNSKDTQPGTANDHKVVGK